ncbi:hypothetical protein C8J57DRAFT_715870 [Mycena rebaudengoi]|nr:hypothetical protein C8J57DRAFT_715870 [Mycena rebaudengoi]
MSTFFPPALRETFNDTGGAGLVGCLLAMGVYGLTTSQTYYYFVEYPKDKIWLKLFVSVLWFLNTLHSALIFHLIYHYLIQNAFNLLGTIQNTWSLAVSMIVHLVVACLVMTYFLNVIFQCSSPKFRWWLAILNGFAVLVFIGFGIDTVIVLFQAPTLLNLPNYTKTAFLPLAASQAGSDSTIAATLCCVLFNHRTGFRRTNSLLYTLMIYAINRCLLTAGTTMVALLMIVFKPDSMMYIGPQFVISGLYTNALMATLNSRHRISAGSRDGTNGINSVHLSNLGSDASGPRKGNPITPMRHHGSHSVNADEFKSDVV